MAVSRSLFLPDDAATEALGRALARHIGPGDTVLLSGQIGAGKTHLVRATIQAIGFDHGVGIEVPSPTYTLVQTYEFEGLTVWHADLYRLGDPGEVVELGLEDAMVSDAVLIEWSDRLPEPPEHALQIELSVQGEGRDCVITSHSDRWAPLMDALDLANA